MPRAQKRGVASEFTEPEFHVLLSLTQGERYGYEIMGEISERTGGEVAPGAGTLYAVLKRLVGMGLIEERVYKGSAKAARAGSQRRRYYGLTATGSRELSEEAGRLERVLSLVRDYGVEPAEPRVDRNREAQDPVLGWDENVVRDGRLPRDASVNLDNYLYG